MTSMRLPVAPRLSSADRCAMVRAMPLRIPMGISSFQRLREDGLTYVDKSLLIQQIIEDPSLVLLLPRPRRFGKTLNLSMLRCYFERSDKDLWPLFAGLAIERAGAACRVHLQRYPVIYLTFKDLKFDTWDECLRAAGRLIAEAFGENDYLLDAGILKPPEVASFREILAGRADTSLLGASLRHLSEYLARHHGERVVILLDEYDTPLHTAYARGYYDHAVTFFRNLLSGAFKDNDHLFKGVLTGILRVAKDSIFTGLNNLDVQSLLSPRYAPYFGFTEPEVEGLLREAGRLDWLPHVQRWYNGYLFGGRVIYNPWSVLEYLKRDEEDPAPFWANTSGNELVRDLLVKQGLGLSADMEALMRGEAIEREVSEHVVLRDLRDRPSLVWSFLLFTGYLKVVRQRREEGTLLLTMAIPNEEIRFIYRGLFADWMEEALGSLYRREELLRALLRGDATTCQRYIQHWLQASASLWDTAAFDPPERFYHGFVLGLLVGLGARYEVVSNRESGFGRCDVLVMPRQPGQPGVVLEFKVVDEGETPEQALSAALQQIEERDYAQALRDRGAAPIHKLAFAFAGKRVSAQRG